MHINNVCGWTRNERQIWNRRVQLSFSNKQYIPELAFCRKKKKKKSCLSQTLEAQK